MRFLELAGRKLVKAVLGGSTRGSPLCSMGVCDAPLGKASGEILPSVPVEIWNQQLAQEKEK